MNHDEAITQGVFESPYWLLYESYSWNQIFTDLVRGKVMSIVSVLVVTKDGVPLPHATAPSPNQEGSSPSQKGPTREEDNSMLLSP